MSIREQQPIFQTQAEILSVHALAPGYFQLVVQAPDMANAASPGQFAQLRIARQGTIDPLLARPISIHQASPGDGTVSFIFKVVGRGTELLAKSESGQPITVLGPIGNGFTVPAAASTIALVAGGVGMPPMYFLAATLRKTRPEIDITLFYGGRSTDDLLTLPAWDALGVTVVTATDDGSHGFHGLVTLPLKEAIEQRTFHYVAACGPRPMLRAVQQLALAANLAGE
ncbi:MAG TPA: dihydroorotate dehydrogenase electron transfer subunit [Armatimonadota bacterium]|nr:dihydroorotate dehydrogenase electron transfer subunit [Armatimonadota bacterium]